jgi:hypothetical protein
LRLSSLRSPWIEFPPSRRRVTDGISVAAPRGTDEAALFNHIPQKIGSSNAKTGLAGAR